ncbi:unnamed protein product [Caenorhabditis brenneri]
MSTRCQVLGLIVTSQFSRLNDVSIRLNTPSKQSTQRISLQSLLKDSVTSLFQISKSVACCAIGIVPDAKFQVKKVLFARRMTDLNQYYTQNAEMSCLGVGLLLISFDDEKGPQVFRVDPAGCFSGMNAVASGTKQGPATTCFEKKIKKKEQWESTHPVEIAIEALQTSLGIDVRQ